ncbi:MAG: class I SAM-dependent methyltransferase [Alphaproteobacteria bacterium]|jgi:SAM-dependent methyltransferase|nr:class I SAM-dependent methyltransferase [Alphaproteobacteria bacterium]
MSVTWKARWQTIQDIALGVSPFRSLQNQWLKEQAWPEWQRVLDIGSKPAAMKVLVPFGEGVVTFSNADEGETDTVTLDITKPLPDGFKPYQAIFCLNVLEHVFDTAAALRFFKAALVPGGVLILITPYLYPYHQAPKDFYRFTADWYAELAVQERWRIDGGGALSQGFWSDWVGFAVSYALLRRWGRRGRPMLAALYGLAAVLDAGMSLLRRGRGCTVRNPLGYAYRFTVLA